MKKIMTILKTRFKDYAPYIAVVAAIILPWLFKPGYLFFTDFVMGPKILLDWGSNYFLLNLILRAFAYFLPVALLEKLFFGLAIGLVFFAGQKLSIAALKLIRSADNERFWLSIFGGLFALFNPFVYDRLMYGQMGIVIAYGFLMLTAAYLFEYLIDRKFVLMACAGIFSGLSLMFSIHFLFFLPLFFLTCAGLCFLNPDKINWKKICLHGIAAMVIILAVNINWFPQLISGPHSTKDFISGGVSLNDFAAFQTSGKTSAEAVKNVIMMSGFWGKDQYRYIDLTQSQNWGRSYILLWPLFMFGIWRGLRSDGKRIKVLAGALLVIFCLSAILAIGIRMGLSRAITQWLFDHLTPYRGLRETQKWVAVEVVVYLIFLVWGMHGFFQKKIIIQNKAVVSVFLGIVIILQAPLLLWGFGRQVKPIPYPADWYQADRLMAPEGRCNGNALFLPWHMYMSFSWTNRVTANPANKFFSCNVITGTDMEWGGIDNSQDYIGREVMGWLKTGGQTDLLHDKNIKYIIVAKELDWGNFAGLAQNSNLELLSDSATLLIYRVKN